MKDIKLFKIIKEIYCRSEDDEVTALGAQLTFYFLLAFFPFLIFLMTLLSYTPIITSEEVLSDLSKLLPSQAYRMVTDILDQIMGARSTTLLSIGMIGTLWVSAKGVTAIIRGLNKAYDQEETRPFWKIWLISLSFTVVFALVILFSFVLLVFGKMLGEYVFEFLGLSEFFKNAWNYLRYLFSLLFMFLVFTSIYRYIPNRRLTFREVIPGSIFSTLGWVSTSMLFSTYVNHFGNYTKTYGSIGGIIILLLWLYWSSIIILLGGELNATLAFNKEGREKPHCKHFS